MAVTHTTTAGGADSGDGKISKNAWNENHTIGTGTVTEAMLSVSDVTTKDVSTSAHGFAPKAPNDATKFLNGAGAWAVPSSGGSSGSVALSQTYLGYNVVGASTETPAVNKMYMKKITVTADSFIADVQVYCYESGGSSQVSATPRMFVITDVSNTPGQVLATSGPSSSDTFYPANDLSPNAADGRWFSGAISRWVTAGDYWIGFQIANDIGNMVVTYDTGGSDITSTAGGGWIIDPNAVTGTTFATTSNKYSIRATVLASAPTIGTASMAHSYLGYNAIGGTVEDAVVNRQICKQVVLSEAGMIESIGAYVQIDTGPDSFGYFVGVWENNAGAVGRLLAAGAPYGGGSSGSTGAPMVIAATDPRWIHIPVGFYAPAGTYWIGIQTYACGFGQNRLNLFYDGSGTDRRFDSAGGYLDDGGFSTQTDTTRKYSIRASFVSASAGTGSGVDYDVSPSPTANDEEFKSTGAATPSGWTSFQTPTTIDTNTTFRSCLYLKKTATAATTGHVGIYRAWSPTAGDCVTTKVVDAVQANANYQRGGGILIGVANPVTGVSINFWLVSNGSGSQISVTRYTAAGTFSSTLASFGAVNDVQTPLYLRVRYNSSTSIDFLVSRTGALWTPVFTGYNPGVTIASIGLTTEPQQATYDSEALFDWLRYGTNVVQSESLLWQNVGGAAAADDPVRAAFGLPSTGYEFNTNSLTGLTTFGSPDVVDANTSVPGALYLKDTSTTWQICGVYAAASPPFTVIGKISDAIIREQYNYAGIFAGAASPGRMALMSIRYDNSGSIRGPGGYGAASPTDSSGLGTTWADTGIQQVSGPIWLALVVNSSTSLDTYYSLNGRVWHKLQSAYDLGATIGSAGLFVLAGSTGSSRTIAASFDFLRIWNSALTLPGW